MAGRVHVTVEANPPRRRRSDDDRDIERDGGSRTPEQDFPMDVIRQRRDVEWSVEQRNTPAP
jgi:hypothetical protein